eukprot:1445905-Pyramimonas_sp.AAC.1
MHFDLQAAPRGHLRIPVDNFNQLQPPTRGLAPKQLTLPAAGNNHQDHYTNDARESNKLPNTAS